MFVIEHYQPSNGASVRLAPLPPDGDARLILAIHVPADDVVLAVVEAPDTESVLAAAAAAQWRVDRLCPASRIAVDSSVEPGMCGGKA